MARWSLARFASDASFLRKRICGAPIEAKVVAHISREQKSEREEAEERGKRIFPQFFSPSPPPNPTPCLRQTQAWPPLASAGEAAAAKRRTTRRRRAAAPAPVPRHRRSIFAAAALSGSKCPPLPSTLAPPSSAPASTRRWRTLRPPARPRPCTRCASHWTRR